LVGASGGGKSTAVALLQRFYEPDAGQISLFGHDLREFDTTTLRQQIAVVPQEVSLLMGSIRENIAYGRLGADEQTITGTAQQTGILEMKLAEGLNTLVGPRGMRLSGGQRQRVAIARALVREAPIIIFDEATSALDTLSEERIRTTLEALRSRHTILLVAHRLSTVRSADIIAVVESGRIVEAGSHAELLRKNGAYAALVQGQESATQTTASLM
jgi:ABC-type multidrug transport system fused ATPase/permease subunit